MAQKEQILQALSPSELAIHRASKVESSAAFGGREYTPTTFLAWATTSNSCSSSSPTIASRPLQMWKSPGTTGLLAESSFSQPDLKWWTLWLETVTVSHYYIILNALERVPRRSDG